MWKNMLNFERVWKCTPEMYPCPPFQTSKYATNVESDGAIFAAAAAATAAAANVRLTRDLLDTKRLSLCGSRDALIYRGCFLSYGFVLPANKM